jgi:hypothetical protein
MQSLASSHVAGGPPVEESEPVPELSTPVLPSEDPVSVELELELAPLVDDGSVDAVTLLVSLADVVSATPDDPEPMSVVAGTPSSEQPTAGHRSIRDQPKGLAARIMGPR